MMQEKGGQFSGTKGTWSGGHGEQLALGSSEDSSSIVSRGKAEHMGSGAGRLQDLALEGCVESQEAFGK